MKLLKRLLIIAVLLVPNFVFAATASFSVSAPSQGVVGNNITVTVTISSSTSLGSWEMALSYDKSYLQLSSAPEGANGTRVAEAHKSSGNKTKTYTYKFKVLKSGTTTISTTSTDAYDWDGNTLSCSNGSKKVTLKTQAEIEASYSSDAYLKSLGVTDYTITPEFDKKTYEYSLEVENNIENVTITGSKNDSNATVSGLGEKELKEGNNKFEIVVTAQKGNTLTYTLNILRKELNPIAVNTDNGTKYIVRKKADMPEFTTFIESTVVYENEEVPALVNEALGYTLIALKDDEGNIKPYIYNNGRVTKEYVEITTNSLTIVPTTFDENVNDKLKEVTVVIKDNTYKGLAFSDNSSQVILKGINSINGQEGIYLYDKNNETFISYSLDDLAFIKDMSKDIDEYKKLIIVLGSIAGLLLILLIIVKAGNKKNKKEDTIVEEKEEIKEEVKEEKVVEEKPKKNKKEKEELPDEIVVTEIIDEDAKKKSKGRKKKEEIKEVKEMLKEEVKEDKKEEKKVKDEVEDPLDEDDNFVDFWNS